MQLSKNFELSEFLKSAYSNKYKEQLNPPEIIINRLKLLAKDILQPARDFFGCPIEITSGYRCWQINKIVGGSFTSQHPRGEAADIVLSKIESHENIKRLFYNKFKFEIRQDLSDNFCLFLFYVCNIDKMNIGQLIHEYGTLFNPNWIHVSSESIKNKKQIRIINPKYDESFSVKEIVEMVKGWKMH